MSSDGSFAAAGNGWTPPSVEELQAMLPQYEIESILGRGGMGAVYRGRQVALERPVAIKILPHEAVGEDDQHSFVERFKLEARAMAGLDHPAIISVHDFGQTDSGLLYFVMEFIDGMDIQKYIERSGGQVDPEHAIAILSHVLDALDYAHSKGIIHRDIKPANVLINREGKVKIADFGLVKRVGGEDQAEGASLTMTNVALGTPDFIAPESLDSQAIPDHRADLYAVGVMLYQMLTGKLPRGMFKLPSEQLPTLDPRFDEIIVHSMESDPDQRYQSALQFREKLNEVLSAPVSRIEPDQASELVAAPAQRFNFTEPGRETISAKPKKAPRQRPERRKTSTGVPIFAWMALTVAALGGGLFWWLQSQGGNGDSVTASGPGSTEPSVTSPQSAGTPNHDKPLKVYLLMGSTNMVGFGRVEGVGTQGTLRHLVEKQNQYPHLVDEAGEWVVRNDVWVVTGPPEERQDWLQPGLGNAGRNIGAELQFGHVMGDYHDEMILIIKVAGGHRSLGWDLLPPGSEPFTRDGRVFAGYEDSPSSWIEGRPKAEVDWYAGKQYDDNIAAIHEVLRDIGAVFPDYRDQGFQMAGIVWWQGLKDAGLGLKLAPHDVAAHAERYEQNLVSLIKNLREEFKAPDAPFVLSTVALDGWKLKGHGLTVANAQLAVDGDAGNYREFMGNVRTIEARDFWRDSSISPGGKRELSNENADTFYRVGDALGRAMVELLENR